MDSAIRFNFGKVILREFVVDLLIALCIYFAFGVELSLLLTIVFLADVIKIVLFWFNVKGVLVTEDDGIVRLNGIGCDVEIVGFEHFSSVRLSYTQGTDKRSVKIPRAAVSKAHWQRLYEARTDEI